MIGAAPLKMAKIMKYGRKEMMNVARLCGVATSTSSISSAWTTSGLTPRTIRRSPPK
jgi:hypothetical protein